MVLLSKAVEKLGITEYIDTTFPDIHMDSSHPDHKPEESSIRDTISRQYGVILPFCKGRGFEPPMDCCRTCCAWRYALQFQNDSKLQAQGR